MLMPNAYDRRLLELQWYWSLAQNLIFNIFTSENKQWQISLFILLHVKSTGWEFVSKIEIQNLNESKKKTTHKRNKRRMCLYMWENGCATIPNPKSIWNSVTWLNGNELKCSCQSGPFEYLRLKKCHNSVTTFSECEPKWHKTKMGMYIAISHQLNWLSKNKTKKNYEAI